MLVYENIEFHNVTQLEAAAGAPGLRMLRFPDALRRQVCADVADLARGVELRFFPDPAGGRHGGAVYLLSRLCDGEATVFWGEYQEPVPIALPKGVVTPVSVEYPAALDDRPAGRFPNRLCRVLINNRAWVSFAGQENLNPRPPAPEDKPARVLVGYGSSITHGGVARQNCFSYLPLAAKELGMDALNLGFSGACRLEAAMADYLADETEGDVYFLELGTNVLTPEWAPEFPGRVEYLLSRVAAAHPDALVLATGPYPVRCVEALRQEYVRVVEDAVARSGAKNLRFVHPDTLLDDVTTLSADSIHPTAYGHARMARNLAAAIRACGG